MKKMFWNNLSQHEQDKYYYLIKLSEPYLAWGALSNTKRALIPQPTCPSDQQFLQMELLAMKGWGMI
jgi:hypothetical protein